MFGLAGENRDLRLALFARLLKDTDVPYENRRQPNGGDRETTVHHALPAAPRKFTLRDRNPISNDDEGRREQSKSKRGLRLRKPEADEDHGHIEQGDRDYLGGYGVESQRTCCHQDNGNNGE